MLSAVAPPASPAMISTASPGTCCSSRKFKIRMPATVGSACRSRRPTAELKSGIARFQEGQVATCAGRRVLEAAHALVVHGYAVRLRQRDGRYFAHDDFLEGLELLGAPVIVGLHRCCLEQPVHLRIVIVVRVGERNGTIEALRIVDTL